MIYLTYNDSPSGIYYSQVADVCNFINKKFNSNIKLVALISSRNYFVNRKKIKSQIAHSIVIPMFPKVGNWRFNILSLFFLFIFLDSKKIIARGPFAATLALWLKNIGVLIWVCFDARGAYSAELNEYEVIKNETIKKNISSIEKSAVLNSDFRISVSNQLVKCWNEMYNYNESNHAVIPCTLNSNFFKALLDEKSILQKRKSLGFSEDDIVFVYSGSSAEWQSFHLIDDFLFDILTKNLAGKILILAPKLPDEMKIVKNFSNRIVHKWLPENEVNEILAVGDYGILLREKSLTNKVASPVKFAEYLFSGLKIIISDDLGDYSEFVNNNNCGIVVKEIHSNLNFERTNYLDKLNLNHLALNNFSKEKFIDVYKKIIE